MIFFYLTQAYCTGGTCCVQSYTLVLVTEIALTVVMVLNALALPVLIFLIKLVPTILIIHW